MCYYFSIYLYALGIYSTYHKTIQNFKMKIIITIILWELLKTLFYKLVNH
jgi:hypothetical protein